MDSVHDIVTVPIVRIVKSLDHVHIFEPAINNLAIDLAKSELPDWKSDFIYSGPVEKVANYFLVFSALSFCYWGEPKWFRNYKGRRLGGSESLFWCLTEAVLDKNIDITDVRVLKELTYRQFKTLLKGDGLGELKFLKERFKILKEISSLLQGYEGFILNMFSEQSYNASEIVKTLVSKAACFGDANVYKGEKIYFWKKAQEVVTLTAERYRSSGEVKFYGYSDLSSSSDYKLPQILHDKGILLYDKELLKKIQNKTILQESSREAIEIRMATLYSVEKIREAVGYSLAPSEISSLLWSLSQVSSRVQYPRVMGLHM